jgi:hypothetical protein
MDGWTLTVEAWRLKMEPKRVYQPLVADSHHFEENWIPIWVSVQVKSGSGSTLKKNAIESGSGSAFKLCGPTTLLKCNLGLQQNSLT